MASGEGISLALGRTGSAYLGGLSSLRSWHRPRFAETADLVADSMCKQVANIPVHHSEKSDDRRLVGSDRIEVTDARRVSRLPSSGSA